jgi:hypothetical protein
VELPRPHPAAPRAAVQQPADLVAKYPTHDDKKAFWRLPTLFKTVQEANKDIGKTYPLVMTSGRLVEYEGGGEETRSNPWLAELQQDMFVEINPKAANDRGIRNGEYVWVKTPPMKAVPEFKGIRVKAWSPSAWAGHGVPAVPLLGPLGRHGHAALLPGRGACRWCAARRSTPPRPTATTA